MTPEEVVDSRIAEWFPYPGYRKGQREMLRAVYETVQDSKTLLLNAPTGSGKSSVVSAILAATTTRPVIVVVRTVAQLNIFVNELQRIRKKLKPDLKFSYVVGRGKVCNCFKEFGVTEKCKYLKKLSRGMILKNSDDHQVDLNAEKYAPVFDMSMPTFCPWFLKSKEYDDVSGKIVDSRALYEKAEEFCRIVVPTERIRDFAGDLCPYEIMRKAVSGSHVVIVNYQHVLNPAIRKVLLGKFYAGGNKPVLVIDEAHNLGSALEELHSSQVDNRLLERARKDLEKAEVIEELQKGDVDIGVVSGVVSSLESFIDYQDQKFKKDDIFDYELFWESLKKVFGGTPKSVFDVLDPLYFALEDYQDRVEERAKSKPEDGCKNIMKVVEFLYLFSGSMFNVKTETEEHNRAIVKIFLKKEDRPALKLRSIDPSEDALELMHEHRAMILMSGTLFPPKVYGRYLFGGEEQDRMLYLSLPNAFPAENRKLVTCVDVTSAYKEVTRNKGDNDNNDRIYRYIREFIRLPGNIAIFFSSYRMMQDYAERLQDEKVKRHFFIEPRNAREASYLLEEFMSLPSIEESGVLLAVSGGKWSEGLDYKGETLVGSMVVGFPLAAFTPEMRWIIEYYEDKYGPTGQFIAYTLPALNRAQQALGRVIRTETDRGFLVLCERRYLENMKSLPEWMRSESERVVVDEFNGLVKDWIDVMK